MKTLIYDKKQLERMLKHQNFYLSEGEQKDFLAPCDIDFINKQFPELPKEGLLVSEAGSLVYKLSDGSVYGFGYGNQSSCFFANGWNFSNTEHWKQATPEQETKFVEMLKKECEKRGLFEDTKIEAHADGVFKETNNGNYCVVYRSIDVWNKHGQIFYKGKFAKPRKESTLDQVADSVKDIADFTIEESPTGLIILTPIK